MARNVSIRVIREDQAPEPRIATGPRDAAEGVEMVCQLSAWAGELMVANGIQPRRTRTVSRIIRPAS